MTWLTTAWWVTSFFCLLSISPVMLMVIRGDIKGHVGNKVFTSCFSLVLQLPYSIVACPPLGLTGIPVFTSITARWISTVYFRCKIKNKQHKTTAKTWPHRADLENPVTCSQISGMNINKFLQWYQNKRCFTLMYVTTHLIQPNLMLFHPSCF